MTEKRFTVIDHNEWSEGDIIYYDDGKEMGWMDVCDKLNELAEENKALRKQLQTEHTMLDNAILLERTRMGKNCLKQFRDAIQ